MTFPVRALVRFGLGLVSAAVVADVVVVYVIGNYDSTLSREANLLLDLALVFGLVLPVAAIAFVLGSLAASRSRDPWRGALVCGAAVALLFFGGVIAIPKSVSPAYIVASLAMVSAFFGAALHSRTQE